MLPASVVTRATIVQFLRGRFATPVLAQLGEVGVLDRLAVDQLRLTDYPQFNPHVLRSRLNYLESLALIEVTSENAWWATNIGASREHSVIVAHRSRIFAIPYLAHGP